jgi:hypothetical protein
MLVGYAGCASWIFVLAMLAELAGYNIYAGTPSVYDGCDAWLFMLSMLAGSPEYARLFSMLSGWLRFLSGWLAILTLWLG